MRHPRSSSGVQRRFQVSCSKRWAWCVAEGEPASQRTEGPCPPCGPGEPGLQAARELVMQWAPLPPRGPAGPRRPPAGPGPLGPQSHVPGTPQCGWQSPAQPLCASSPSEAPAPPCARVSPGGCPCFFAIPGPPPPTPCTAALQHFLKHSHVSPCPLNCTPGAGILPLALICLPGTTQHRVCS